MTDLDKPVVILGAGVNGAAIARELVLNGVPVCVVDTADIASGTTAFSSRLIHGGLLYLEHADLRLVREALAERSRLLRLAPQFIRPLRLYIPVGKRLSGVRAAIARWFGHRLSRGMKQTPRGLWLVRLGLWLYEALGNETGLPRHAVHRAGGPDVPTVRRERFRWLCSYSDAQMTFPERFVLALLEDARCLAADRRVWFKVFNYHSAKLTRQTIEIFPTPTDRDRGGSSSQSVASFQPSAIVNATGAWVDRTLQRLRVRSPQLIGGTKGSHLLTFNAELRKSLVGGGLYAEAGDARPVFMLPFGEATLVGTTDLPYTESPESAVANEAELSYLIDAVNAVFPHVALAKSDVALHYSGVRPLPFASSAAPAAITRQHRIERHDDCPLPMFSVIGGKLTTSRLVAEQVAAVLLQCFGRRACASSSERAIPGGANFPLDENALQAEQERLANRLGFGTDQIRAVWRLCGTRTQQLLSAEATDPRGEEDDRANVAGTLLPIRFVRRVIRDEWVRRLSDLVERRLMLLYDRELSERTLRHLAELMSSEGICRREHIAAEVEACRLRLMNHFGRTIRGSRASGRGRPSTEQSLRNA